MNKNSFWNKISKYFELAKDNELATLGTWLGYLDKNENTIEIDYKSMGINYQNLISLFEELQNDNLIEIIDSNNMGYYIIKK